jgi:AraC-like DNA-binding protein
MKKYAEHFEFYLIFSGRETEITVTHFPLNLKNYPNMDTPMPLHIKINQLKQGYPAHRHDFLEFSYVIGGKGSEIVNGVRHPMIPGTFTFILPYQIHEIFTEPGETLVLINCMFSMDLLMEAGENSELDGILKDEEQLSAFIQLSGDEHEHFLRHLHEMLNEYSGHDRWRSAMLKAKLTEVLVRFDRRRRQDQPVLTFTRQGITKASPTWRIIHYIQRNYQEPLTLADLSEQFSISMSRISERIKETTGLTFVEFINELRIRHACSLLLSTEMSVSEIAYEVGYGSYKTFSRLFRAMKGISPSGYRKENIR